MSPALTVFLPAWAASLMAVVAIFSALSSIIDFKAAFALSETRFAPAFLSIFPIAANGTIIYPGSVSLERSQIFSGVRSPNFQGAVAGC